ANAFLTGQVVADTPKIDSEADSDIFEPLSLDEFDMTLPAEPVAPEPKAPDPPPRAKAPDPPPRGKAPGPTPVPETPAPRRVPPPVKEVIRPKPRAKAPPGEAVKVALNEVPESAVLARDIIGSSGTLLLAAGTPFRKRYIRRLQELKDMEGEIEYIW